MYYSTLGHVTTLDRAPQLGVDTRWVRYPLRGDNRGSSIRLTSLAHLPVNNGLDATCHASRGCPQVGSACVVLSGVSTVSCYDARYPNMRV